MRQGPDPPDSCTAQRQRIRPLQPHEVQRRTRVAESSARRRSAAVGIAPAQASHVTARQVGQPGASGSRER